MEGLIDIGAVTDLVQLSRTTVHRLRVRREFPYPVKTGVRRTRWKREDVLKWIASRKPEAV